MPAQADWVKPALDPTWTQVEELEPIGTDDDEWEEDEVSYITLDFGKGMNPDLIAGKESVQIAGLTGTDVFALVGTQHFRGQHHQLIGTEILLQRQADGSGPGAYAHLANTTSRIVFDAVTLTKKAHAEPSKSAAPAPPAGPTEAMPDATNTSAEPSQGGQPSTSA